MNNDKIGTLEAISLVIIVIISHLILNLPNELLSSTLSAATLNVIYITGIVLLLFLFATKLFKPFKNKDILDVAEYVGGDILKKIVSTIYSLHLIFISGILIASFADTIKAIYLQNMPSELICLLFILIAVLANLFGFKSVSRTNAILMPFILITILIIFISLFTAFVPERIFPILGYGVNETFVMGASNIFAFGELLILFLIRPNLSDNKQAKKVGVSSILLSGLFLLLSVTALLLLFPFITGGEGVLSIYMITRSIHFGNFFQRVDALFILIWALTFFSYLSVIISYVLKIAKKNVTSQKSSSFVFLIAIAIFIVTLIPQNISQIRFAENVIYKYSSLIVVFGLSFLILILGYFKKKKSEGLVQIDSKKINNEVSDES